MKKYIKINEDNKIEILPDGETSDMTMEIFIRDITKGSDLDIDKEHIPKQFKNVTTSTVTNAKPQCYSDNFNTYCLDKNGNYIKQ